MRYLGIDYGTKNIGLALSDEAGMLAYPHTVLAASKNVIQDIADVVDQERIDEVVVGHSVDQKGNDNVVMKQVHDLIGQLSLITMKPIHLEKEMFTSLEASRQDISRPTARKPKSKINKKDDSAAALILQRFLDKQ